MDWTRKELKQNANQTLKANRMNLIIVCLVIAVVASGYFTSTLGWRIDSDDLNIKSPLTVSSQVKEIVDNVNKQILKRDKAISEIEDKFTLKNATDGVIATILNNGGQSKSFLVGLLNTVNHFVFSGEILESTILAISTALIFLFWMFVQNVLIVGECRFFLETKNYHKSNAKRLLFVYQVKKTLHVAWIMFLKMLYTFLWGLTIVGGPIKHYSYFMVPYILAENPTISRKDAFALSKEMMKGNKWKVFKLDMSFFFWQILSLISFGIVGFVYVNPYLSATRSEFYFKARQQEKQEQTELSKKLCDDNLLNVPEKVNNSIYPMQDYIIPVEISRRKQELEYNRKYSVISLVYIFFSIAFIGWLWEVFLYLMKTGGFVNRGTLKGPWLPIYGVGSLLVLLILQKLIEKPPLFFLGSFLVCGVLEYFTSWILEKLFGQSWWNYSEVFFNINGRVSLEGLLFFATGACLVAYVIAPSIDNLVQKIPIKLKYLIALCLITIFSVDVITGYFNPNLGDGISKPVSGVDK